MIYKVFCEMYYHQNPREHIQAFAWRIHTSLISSNGEQDVPEEVLLDRVMMGLHPLVKQYLPSPQPTTLEQLFVFADAIAELLPQDDSGWSLRAQEISQPPKITVEVENEYFNLGPANPKDCYRSRGVAGHYAQFCINKRNNRLKPKRKRCRRKKN